MPVSKLSAFLIGFIILAADALSKYFTQYYLPLVNPHHFWYPYGGIGIFQNFLGIEFSLNYVLNKGAAWGVFFDYQQQLLYLRIVLISGMLVYFLFINKVKSNEIPLMMIFAGAVGNVIDYFLYGHVIDMFHFVLWGYDFPVFNLADAAIFLGVSWLFIASFFAPGLPKKKPRKA